MNRLQFLVELKNSLLKTTKEFSLPLITEELEKVEDIAGELVGVKWLKLEGTTTSFLETQEYFLNKKPILLYSNGEEIKAYEKLCANCQALAKWISYDKTLKCFNCERTFNIQLEVGDLNCKRYYMKEENGQWFIGE